MGWAGQCLPTDRKAGREQPFDLFRLDRRPQTDTKGQTQRQVYTGPCAKGGQGATEFYKIQYYSANLQLKALPKHLSFECKLVLTGM